MTRMTKTLATTAIALAFAGTPALAGDHNDGTMKTNTETEMQMHKKHKAMKKEHEAMKATDDMTEQHVEAHMKHKAKHKIMTSATEVSATDTSMIEGDMKTDYEDKIGQVLQTDNMAGKNSPGEEVVMYDGDVEDKVDVKAKDDDSMLADNAIVVPTTEMKTLTTVTCPPGTEAQVDMTCLVTGDFEFEQPDS